MTLGEKLPKQSKKYLLFSIFVLLFLLVFVDYVYYGKITCGALKTIKTWHAAGQSNQYSASNTSLHYLDDDLTHRAVISRARHDDKLSFDEYWKSDFDIQASDVIVFLHIQKTGGTSFGKHLVRHLQLDQPCRCKRFRKRCRCYRPNSKTKWWLFSRYSTGWGCGLHADWTELTSCVDGELDKLEGEHTKRRSVLLCFKVWAWFRAISINGYAILPRAFQSHCQLIFIFAINNSENC